MSEQTAVDLPAIRALLAGVTEGPWFANRYYVAAGEDQSDPDAEVARASFKADAAFIAAAPSIVAQLLGVVERVEALHQPVTVYAYDDTDGVFKVDDAGEQIEMKTLCSACTGASVLELIGDCEYDELDYHDETAWPCPTIQALTGEGQ